MTSRLPLRSALLAVSLSVCMTTNQAWAHCDSIEGPVVQDARIALEKGDPSPVFKWVSEEYEPEIREVFKQAVAVRAKGNDARNLADRYFFETLIRIHRAGEGEAFEGLKAASSVDPGIVAADTALQSRSARQLVEHISVAVSEGIQKRFEIALERKKHAAESVEAGREYVEAYVSYIHFVEEINRIASHGAPHGHHASKPSAEH